MNVSIDSRFRVDKAARTILASNLNAYNRSYVVVVRGPAHACYWWLVGYPSELCSPLRGLDECFFYQWAGRPAYHE